MRKVLGLSLKLAAVGVALYLFIGAAVGGGFGFRLPGGSRYLFRFQVEIGHVQPVPPPVVLPGIERM